MNSSLNGFSIGVQDYKHFLSFQKFFRNDNFKIDNVSKFSQALELGLGCFPPSIDRDNIFSLQKDKNICEHDFKDDSIKSEMQSKTNVCHYQQKMKSFRVYSTIK